MIIERCKIETNGIVEYLFDVHTTTDVVPCVLWYPTTINALIVVGHGGAQHKQSTKIRTRALRHASAFGWATLSIDAPGHGERITPEEAALAQRNTLARINGEPNAPALSVPDKIKYLDTLSAQAVNEWQVVLSTLYQYDIIDKDIPLAYLGVSQGSSIGIPLLASTFGFRCAVLGLSHLHPAHESLRQAAMRIEIPLRFVFQWDDAIRHRDYGLALFESFKSMEKSMHINSGGHCDVPEMEAQSWDVFFGHHLGCVHDDEK